MPPRACCAACSGADVTGQRQNDASGAADGKPGDGRSRASRTAKAIGAALLLLASRLWAGLVGGWRELGRRDAADIASARTHAVDEAAEGGQEKRRRSILTWLPRRRTAVVALVLLLLLLLWRCGHDGVPTGNRPDVADSGVASVCDGLLDHEAWTGKLSYSHARDVTSAGGEDHLRYAFVVDVGAELAERSRRQHRGADSSVQYFNPEPRGRIEAELLSEHFDRVGLRYRKTFVADGGLQRFAEGMSENGSMLFLTVEADCSYKFGLQGQVMGKSEIYSRPGPTRPGDDMLWVPGVRGSGIADNGSRLSGTREFKLMSGSHLEATRHLPDQGDWVSELDQAEKILGRENLGTVTVTWDFRAVD